MIIKDEINLDDIFPNFKTQNIPFRYPNFQVTPCYLKKNKNVYFVFEDDLTHKRLDHNSRFRYLPNVIPFITSKDPFSTPDSYFTIDEYFPIFKQECNRILKLLDLYSNKFFLFSKLGEYSNHYCIYDKLIKKWLFSLVDKPNVSLLF